ncbi:MAG TPA: hypothetical protein VGJ20_35745 [Xanthobacteraceae bacterium]|jgi:hypothetical protein
MRERGAFTWLRHRFGIRARIASAYTDEELAALATYASGQFGFREGRVTADQIRKQRLLQ